MKKLLTLTCVAVLTFGLAAATYADVEFGASGFIRVRSAWYMNTPVPAPTIDIPGFTTNTAWDDTNAWMDTRFRIKFTGKLDDVAKGVIYLEGDASPWGSAAGTRNTMGFWNADRAAVEVKQAYLDFKVPGTDAFPTKLQAGIIGFNYRAHVCMYADGAGVRLDTTAGPVKIQVNWMKPWEGNNWQADDTDIYAFRVVVPVGPVRPGFWAMWYDSNSWGAGTPLVWPAVGGWGPPNTGQNLGTDKADLYWLGFQLDGKAGPVGLKADFVYNFGEIERQYPQVNPTVVPFRNPIDDEDFGGWLFYADAVYTTPTEFPIDVGATFLYATGDDLDDARTKRDHDGYWLPPGSEAGWIGTHGIVFYPSAINDGVSTVTGGMQNNAPFPFGPGGTWFGKLYAGVKPIDWLKVTFYGMYIGDTADSGDMYGNAASTTWVDPMTGLIVPLWEDNSDIGIEFGLITDFQIYKNLKYSIGGGYLMAGDALDRYTWVDFIPATGAYVIGGTVPGAIAINDEPANPWAIVSNLTFSF